MLFYGEEKKHKHDSECLLLKYNELDICFDREPIQV